MSKKIVVKHRRGTTAEWQEWLSNTDNVLLDGEIALEDVPEAEGQPNKLRMLIGDGTHHTYDTMPKIDMPGYAQVVNNAVVSHGYDYAEYFRWADDVSAEDRVAGRFVTIVDNTRTIRIAKSTDNILGITSNTASIIGNWQEGDRNLSEWAVVGMIGIIEVRHDGTCTKNGYAMVNDNGEATFANDAFGYKIVDVNTDANTVELVLGNDSDMIARMQERIVALEDNTANMSDPSITGKLNIDGATIYRELDDEGDPTGSLVLELPWHGNAAPPMKIKLGEDKLSYIDNYGDEFDFYHTGNLLDITKLDNKLGDVDSNNTLENIGAFDKLASKENPVIDGSITIKESVEWHDGDYELRLDPSGTIAFSRPDLGSITIYLDPVVGISVYTIDGNERFFYDNISHPNLDLTVPLTLSDGVKKTVRDNIGVTDILGDIESSLDAILAMQESYIGGDDA